MDLAVVKLFRRDAMRMEDDHENAAEQISSGGLMAAAQRRSSSSKESHLVPRRYLAERLRTRTGAAARVSRA